MRLHVFLTEAKIAHCIDVITVQADALAHRELFARAGATGIVPSFPIVEHSRDNFEVDSQQIIERLADEHRIDVAALRLLRFYNESMLPRFGRMFMELRRLKGDDWKGDL